MNPPRPPQLFLRFFRWYCKPRLRNHLEGDLMELYNERCAALGKRKANRKFIVDVLQMFRPGIIRPLYDHKPINPYGMYKSYFKIGWRNLAKNKGYSFINIGGLAMGLMVAMLIGLWIYDELSFDTYHENYNDVVQVMQHQTVDGAVITEPAIPWPLETELRNTYGADFKYIVLATWINYHALSHGEEKITKLGIYTQPDFPEMISLHMIAGTRDGLRDANSVLVSASTARALFGTGDPLNQSIRIDGRHDAKITGVYEDLPHNTTFRDFQFISTWDLYVTTEPWIKPSATNWGNNSFQLFAQLNPHTDINTVSKKIENVKAKNSKEEAVLHPRIFLHPMRDWRLHSEWKNGVHSGGRIQMVLLFGVIGVFVLLLACINFMNLSTARSEKRAKEVGIRMTMGSVRRQLVHQFLSESFLVVALAFIIALALTGAALPWFNALADKHIVITWLNPVFWLISAGFILVTSLLAGSYPSLYLSSFQPVKVLKGIFKSGPRASLPRKVLVVVQFTVSVALIIGTTLVYQQIQFTKSRPAGYTREGLLTIQMSGPEFFGKFDALRTALKQAGTIEEMAESSSPITDVWLNSNGFTWSGKDPGLAEDFGAIFITAEYGPTIGWKMKEGRNFSRDFPADSSAVIINEAAAKYMGVKDPIGMEVTWGSDRLHVIGIVKDMITESPYKPVRQTVYLMNYRWVNWMLLKLNPARSAHETLAETEAIFKKIIPATPFEYKFIDDTYAAKFDAEERIGKLASFFTIFAIFISCLGLFGLASFVAEQRTKEIGIRKVLGASVANLRQMLSLDFVALVVVACVLAIPVAYYFLQEWLLSFPYHTEMAWWVFAGSAGGAIALTLLTVSYQAIRAAMANPVKSLRSE